MTPIAKMAMMDIRYTSTGMPSPKCASCNACWLAVMAVGCGVACLHNAVLALFCQTGKQSPGVISCIAGPSLQVNHPSAMSKCVKQLVD